MSIPVSEILAKLPVAKLEASLIRFIEPMIALLPDERLKKVVVLAVQCILSCQKPVVTSMARAVSRLEAGVWAAAKRIYRFLRNERFDHQTLFTGLYQIARRTVEQESPDSVHDFCSEIAWFSCNTKAKKQKEMLTTE